MKTLKLAYTPFKGLKEVLEKRHFALRKQDIVEDRTDEEIFREAMSDVREITEFRKILPGQPPNIGPLPSQKDDSLDVLSDIVKGKTKIRLSDTAEYIEWVRPRIRKDIAEKLHRGEFSVQDSIDLHGMTLVEAEEALSCFFRTGDSETPLLREGNPRQGTQVASGACPQGGTEKVPSQVIQ